MIKLFNDPNGLKVRGRVQYHPKSRYWTATATYRVGLFGTTRRYSVKATTVSEAHSSAEAMVALIMFIYREGGFMP